MPSLSHVQSHGRRFGGLGANNEVVFAHLICWNAFERLACSNASSQGHSPFKEKRNALKPATIVGILLVVVGIIGFAVGGISFTHEKKDVDMEPVQISHKQTKTVPISPILSTVALVGGIGLVVVGVRAS